jgi:hypothetical protein
MDRTRAFADILTVTIMMYFCGAVEAHKPLLSVGDNQDGTISIEAGFSDGSSAAGHKIILKDEKTEAVISEHRVGEDGTLQLKKPSVAYTVTLDAGEGHTVVKAGPAASASDTSGDSVKTEAESTEEKSSPVKPVTAPSQAASASETVARVQSGNFTQASTEISPGALMAFKMMITAQIVTATALIILLTVIAYWFGYTMGKKSGTVERN